MSNGPALLLARLRRSPKAGERQRVVHLFVVQPGSALPPRLVALCDAELAASELEWCDRPFGMVCETCFARTHRREHFESRQGANRLAPTIGALPAEAR